MTPVGTKRTVIPTPAWVVAACLFAATWALILAILAAHRYPVRPQHVALGLVVGSLLAGYAVLVGYVYADAKHRGMRYVMWTWLAILIPNGLGIILYFILRDPMPFYCTRCGGATPAGFAFCARCGAPTAATCRQCGKVSQPGWSHCAYCGTQL